MSARAIVLALLSFFLLACSTESRKDPGGEYWRNFLKDKSMTEANIIGLIAYNPDSTGSSTHSKYEKANCHEKKFDGRANAFTKEFEPIPNVSAYPDDKIDDHVSTAFTRDFEPTPNVTAYPDDKIDDHVSTAFTRDFEPTPNITAYPDDKIDDHVSTAFARDFEPTPNVSAYPDDKMDA